MKHQNIISLVFCTCTTIYSCSPFKEGHCDINGGRPYLVYKRPEKFYPVIANDWSATIKGTIGLLNQIDTVKNKDTNVEIDMKKKVVELREKLGQENIKIENVVKSAFIAYNISPCDESARQKYFALLEAITHNANVAREVTSKLTEKSKSNSSITTEVITNPEVISDVIDNANSKLIFDEDK
jgi:signal recognition particle GTPase